MRSRALILGHLVGLASLLGTSACGDKPKGMTDAGGTDAQVADSSCHEAARREDGSCCPAGQFYDFATDSCAAVGPPACADTLPDSPAACVPRWCGDWRDDDGEPCKAGADRCQLVGRGCTAAELSAGLGCPVGWWRAPGGSSCVPAGAVLAGKSAPLPPKVDPSGKTILPPLPTLAESIPAGVPPLEDLPKLAATRFCGDPDAVRICRSGESGCGPGKMPDVDPAAGASCIDVGVPWDCPAGFSWDPTKPTKPGVPASCRPDPKACTTGAWGGKTPGADALWVSKKGGKDGTGSKDKPFATLADAVAAASPGATIAIDQGTYVGSVIIDKALTLRGRCSADVRLLATGGRPTIAVTAPAKHGPVVLSGLQVGGAGVGLKVADGAAAKIARLAVINAREHGILVEGGSLEGGDVLVEGTVPFNDYRGYGVSVEGSGIATLRAVRVHDNHDRGVSVMHPGSRFIGRHVIVDATRSGTFNLKRGNGVVVRLGAMATLTSSRVSANRDVGVLVNNDASIDLRGVVVDNTRHEQASWLYGFGVMGWARATIRLRGVRLHKNLTAGLDADGIGTFVRADGLIVDGTRQQLANLFRGEGISVTTRAVVQLRSARISDSVSAGIMAHFSGATLEVDGVLVDRTRPDKAYGKGGSGANIVEGGILRGRGLRVTDADSAGIVVAGRHANTDIRDVLVDNTRATSKKGAQGYGLLLGEECRARVANARLTANLGGGVVVNDKDASLWAANLLIDGTESTDAKEATGQGLVVSDGARARVFGARLSGNRVAGISVQDSGSRLDVAGVVVDGTREDQVKHIGGVGIIANAETALNVAGASILSNRYVGVALQEARDPVRIVGARIADIRPRSVGSTDRYGTGVSANRGTANVTFIGCAIANNHSAGMLMVQTSATVTRSVVSRTQPELALVEVAGAKPQQAKLADGIVAHQCDAVTLNHVVVSDHERAGIVLHSIVHATARHALITKTGFGLSARDNAKLETGALLLYGNQSNRAGDALLAIPKPPKLAGL